MHVFKSISAWSADVGFFGFLAVMLWQLYVLPALRKGRR